MSAGRPLTIVATDSGLGGLSVVAELARALRAARRVDEARVIFFNCRPALREGFNTMTPERRLRVFDRALRAMHRRHDPDAILIACHTLSAIYPLTPFAQRPPTMVRGIVPVAAELIASRLIAEPSARAVLLGTPVTTASDAYPRALAERGIDSARVLPIEVRRLAGAIERGGDHAGTREVIEDLAQRVRDASPECDAPHLLCLLCTHYPYVGEAIREAVTRRGVRVAGIVDPNAQMAADFVESLPQGETVARTRVEVRVEAQIAYDDAAKAGVIALLAQRCPDTAAALRDGSQHELFAIE